MASGGRGPDYGPDDPEVVGIIQAALASGRPITATYKKKRRELSPLMLGIRDGGYRLWAYQYGGESGYGCKCFVVAGLHNVKQIEGDAPRPEFDPGPDSCMDESYGSHSAG